MKAILAAIAVVIALLLVQPIAERITDHNAYQRQAEALDLAAQQHQLDQQQAFDAATFAGRVSSDYGLRLILFASTALALMYLVDSHRRRQVRIDADRRLVYPDQAGRLPVARVELESGTVQAEVFRALELFHQRQIADAIHQPGQQPASYAPHLIIKNDAPEAAAAVELAAPARVPTFADLLDRGRVGKGNPLLLGFEAGGQELTGSWLDLYSTIVAGMSGTGKTTSQRSLACQTALHGAKFAICDPHAGAADDSLSATLAPLSSVFVCEPASSDKQILEVVRYVADMGRRRVEGKDSDTTPLILWVDELTALLGRSSVAEPLAELLEQVAQEYRKRFVFVCGSGQLFTASRTTSELRDSFASVLCHRMKRNQARLLLPTDEAEQVERLSTGRAVLWRTSGATTTLQIPNTTAGDVQMVATLLATPRHTDMPKGSQHVAHDMPDSMPTGSQTYASGGLAYSAAASAEARRAHQMFMDGADPAAIVLTLRGIRSNEGKKYQVALAEILSLIGAGALAG
jgi:hypothetical protein